MPSVLITIYRYGQLIKGIINVVGFDLCLCTHFDVCV